MLDLIISKYHVSYNLIKTLKTTNAKLWDIEDKIRIKERERCFDAEFIELAYPFSNYHNLDYFDTAYNTRVPLSA